MNKMITGAIVTILVFGGLIWAARPNAQNTVTPSAKINNVLTAVESSYDFGTISMAQGPVTHQFKIKNTGNEKITINKVYTSCMCTAATLMAGGKQFGPYGMLGHGANPEIDGAVNPDKEAIVSVAFDPAAHGPAGVGRIERTITLENDAGGAILLQFTVLVTP